MLRIVILTVIMLSVIILSVVMMSVVAPSAFLDEIMITKAQCHFTAVIYKTFIISYSVCLRQAFSAWSNV
jgi:hypothetical protein